MNRRTTIALLGLVVAMCACQSRELNTQTSFLTGWKNFDPKTTNFEAYEGNNMAAPAGMLMIPGGSFIIGQMDEFITAPHNSERRTLTVSSFYMDKYEVSNIGWREYVEWTNFVFGSYNQDIVKATLPDSTVWREEMAYNEPYISSYFRHPAYSFYPVVGVSWDQAMAYCQWRTDRVNEKAMIASKFIDALPYAKVGPDGYMSEEEIDNFLKRNEDHPEYAKYDKLAVEIPLSQAKEYGYEGNEVATEDGSEPKVTMYRLPYEWVRDHFVFNTEKYLNSNQYNPTKGKGARKDAYGNDRKINIADGVLVTGYRLPTEAEWEYAARGGNESQGYKYSGSNIVENVAWYAGNSASATHNVKTESPNELGIYDMSGNVYEWCEDWHGDYSSGSQTNPTGPSTGSARVLRGGCWNGVASHCRVSNRGYFSPSFSNSFLGFRVVCLP